MMVLASKRDGHIHRNDNKNGSFLPFWGVLGKHSIAPAFFDISTHTTSGFGGHRQTLKTGQNKENATQCPFLFYSMVAYFFNVSPTTVSTCVEATRCKYALNL